MRTLCVSLLLLSCGPTLHQKEAQVVVVDLHVFGAGESPERIDIATPFARTQQYGTFEVPGGKIVAYGCEGAGKVAPFARINVSLHLSDGGVVSGLSRTAPISDATVNAEFGEQLPTYTFGADLKPTSIADSLVANDGDVLEFNYPVERITDRNYASLDTPGFRAREVHTLTLTTEPVDFFYDALCGSRQNFGTY